MEKTIAAISTAVSASGIGIVRISGEESMDVISRIYRSKGGKKDIRKAASHTIHYGYIYDGEELIDEVLVMIMHAPVSYTHLDVYKRQVIYLSVYFYQSVSDHIFRFNPVLNHICKFQ